MTPKIERLEAISAKVRSICDDLEETGQGSIQDRLTSVVVDLLSLKMELGSKEVLPTIEAADEAAKRHEKHGKAFLVLVDAILIDALKLSPDVHAEIFQRVSNLKLELRKLFEENSFVVQQKARARFAQWYAEQAKHVPWVY